jgi:uncharacterized coiled-coil DUF342 family protein
MKKTNDINDEVKQLINEAQKQVNMLYAIAKIMDITREKIEKGKVQANGSQNT